MNFKDILFDNFDINNLRLLTFDLWRTFKCLESSINSTPHARFFRGFIWTIYMEF